VFISSQLEEVVRLSDRIVVLKDREKIGELSNGPGVTVDTIVEMIAADLDGEPEELFGHDCDTGLVSVKQFTLNCSR
jgi:galactofuranose transport system ATP-binding protein